MSQPRDTLRPQNNKRMALIFLAIVFGWMGLVSTWRLFTIGAAILPTILSGVACGLIYVLVERIWRREGEYLKRYTDAPEETREALASSANLRH
jgi:hypothetical protein